MPSERSQSSPEGIAAEDPMSFFWLFADRDLVVARSLSLKIEIEQTFDEIVSR